MPDTIQIGDRVRVYGFDDTRDSYSEGVVESIGTELVLGFCRYRIRLSTHVIGGNVTAAIVGAYRYPAINGSLRGDGNILNFVELIRESQAVETAETAETSA